MVKVLLTGFKIESSRNDFLKHVNALKCFSNVFVDHIMSSSELSGITDCGAIEANISILFFPVKCNPFDLVFWGHCAFV